MTSLSAGATISETLLRFGAVAFDVGPSGLEAHFPPDPIKAGEDLAAEVRAWSEWNHVPVGHEGAPAAPVPDSLAVSVAQGEARARRRTARAAEVTASA